MRKVDPGLVPFVLEQMEAQLGLRAIDVQMVLQASRNGRGGRGTMFGGTMPIEDVCADNRARLWTGKLLFVPTVKHVARDEETFAGSGLTGLMTDNLGIVGPDRLVDRNGLWLLEHDR